MNGPDAAPPTVMSGTGQEDPYRPALPLRTITPFQFVYCTTLFQFFGFLFFLVKLSGFFQHFCLRYCWCVAASVLRKCNALHFCHAFFVPYLISSYHRLF